jgi:hypothetical protein
MQVLIEWLFGSIPLLGKLFLNYITNGPFFVVLHLIVVWLFYRTWYSKVSVEADALERWKPRGPASADAGGWPARRRLPWWPRRRGGAETTRILDQFVADCDKLGGQGVFIPMTDFSDRLDSIVDGITAEMHDRTNLFILVGVAGTLLGVFEFAFRAHDVLLANAGDPGKGLPDLSTILTDSMSKAFPVGFVGLLLTFASQVIASFPERRLRTALAEATGKALKAREETSRSQAGSLQDSVRAMQEAMTRSVESMRGALSPLANLQETLGKFVEPAMNQLRDHLGNSLKLVSAQFDEMQKTNAGTQEIVNSAKQAVGSLREIVGSLVNQAEQTRAVNDNTIQLQRQQQESLAAFSATIAQQLGQVKLINDSINTAAANVESLPGRMQGATQATLDGLARDTLSAWRGMSDELKAVVVGEHKQLLEGVAAQAQSIHDSLLAASSRLDGVASEVRASVDGLTHLPEHLEGEMKKVFGLIAVSSTDYWNGRTDDFVSLMSEHQANFLRVIRERTEDVERSLREASNQLTDISQRMDLILGDSLKAAIKEAKSEIEVGLQQVNRVLIETYPQMSRDVIALSGGLRDAVEQSREIQRESAAWLGGIQGAYGKLEEINRLLTQALERAREENAPTNAEQARALLQQNVEEVRRLSDLFARVGQLIPAPAQVQNASDGLRAGLDRATHLLTQIRNDLAARLHEEPPDDGPRWWPSNWFSRRRGRRGSNGGR